MIEKRPFGRSGHQSSAVIFGGAALGAVDQAAADATLDVLLEHGVNHIDTARSYGNAELRIGPWMKNHRDDFFLATKTGERTYTGAWDELRRSLDNLCTDHVDLIQLHALYHPDDWDLAMGDGGALEALTEAKQQGLARHIGVTGHGWTIAAMHLRSLARFDFDAVLLPYNYVMYADARYRREFESVLSACRARNVAVQTIKAIARGPWAKSPVNRATWYEPLEEAADIERAVHWVLGDPRVFLNAAGDVDLLPKVLAAAARYEARPDDEAMQEMLQGRAMTSLFGING